jgi:hypothetical protein
VNLFTNVPDNFFSILASKNKEIYAMALAVLYQCLQNDEMSIKKDEFLRTLKETSSDLVMKFDFQGEGDDFSTFINAELPSKAAFILRRLEETGWVEIELDPDSFHEYIALPNYSIQFLTLINDLMDQSHSQYNSLVHSTYSELKLEDEERDEFMFATLWRVYENTKKLRVELVTLGHSIRIYQHKLSKVFSTNRVLSDYFDNYKTRISDRLYHPLKTYDSVAKFKRHIIKILQSWLNDEKAFNILVTQAMVMHRYQSKSDAEAEIVEKINYISDMYEQMNRMINEIDVKHSDYTKSSATKILYLNNSDRSIKGHLENIFKHYAEATIQGQGVANILNKMQDSLIVCESGYIVPDSLTLPLLRRYRDVSDPMMIVDFEEATEALLMGFLDQTRNSFSNERIDSFMKRAFGKQQSIHIKEIPLPDYDAFILLILASVRSSEKNCFYDLLVDDGKIQSNGYILPNFTFKRKETVNV